MTHISNQIHIESLVRNKNGTYNIQLSEGTTLLNTYLSEMDVGYGQCTKVRGHLELTLKFVGGQVVLPKAKLNRKTKRGHTTSNQGETP